MRLKSGALLIQYGCETHVGTVWRKNLRALCSKHKLDEAERYVSALTALFDLIELAAKP